MRNAIWAAISVFSATAWAGEALTEAQAVAMALARAPQLAAQRQAGVAASARVSVLNRLSSPELRVGVADLVTDETSRKVAHNNVGLRWSPPSLADLRVRGAAARARAGEVESETAVSEQQLAAEVRVMFRSLGVMDEQIRVAEAGVHVRERILQAVMRQVEAGVKNALDQSAAELAVFDARPQLNRLRGEREVVAAALAGRLGYAPNELPPLRFEAGVLECPTTAPDRAQLLRSALAHRPELKASEWRCAQSDAEVRGARMELFPWISYMQVMHRMNNSDDPGSWGVQAGMELPVFRWRPDALKAARAEAGACRLRQQAARAAIGAELDEVLTRMRVTSGELDEYRAALDGLAARHVATAEAALKAGQSDLVEPMLAEARRLSLEQAYLGKLRDYKTLEVGLGQAVGAVW